MRSLAFWSLVLALAGVSAWLALRPNERLAPLPPPEAPRPGGLPPFEALGMAAPRRLHDLDLTVVRMRDRVPVASTSAQVKPLPVSDADALILVATTDGPRPLYVRLFAVDAGGAVKAITDESGPPLEWRAPSDGGTYPILSLDLAGLRGGVRILCFAAAEPFPLAQRTIAQALRPGHPLGDAALDVPAPEGPAGATFAQISVSLMRLASQ